MNRMPKIAIAIVVLFFLSGFLSFILPRLFLGRYHAKISRTRSDLRSINSAIVTYCLDNNRYPSMQKDKGIPLKELNLSKSSIAKDPFGNSKNKEYSYFLYRNAELCILLGNGPDKDRDLNLKLIKDNVDTSKTEDLEEFLIDYTYDPTNGLKSSGDILRSENVPISLINNKK